ncbi:MAG: hypothetical protein HOH66_12335 [Rhodospirillaceae bacterium]|jgi:hypothetical protein|nr:hypothetical protein [Rhodospirillaceae bacterium]MBT6118645.1 hypothetical protein [Rhodospirillaceae bacterium]
MLRTALQYREYVGLGLSGRSGAYTRAQRLLVLNVTMSRRRMENLLSIIGKVSADNRNSTMLFQYLPQFGRHFAPPKPLPHLLHGPWRRAGCEDFAIDSA